MNTARELTSRLAELLRREHSAMAEFVAALAEFDERRLWEQLDYTSLFWFLHRELGLSRSAAFYRKEAAELVQRHPEVLQHLRSGELCLTSVAELAKVLTPENRTEILPRFFNLSAREAKEVTAAILPAAALPLRDVVTLVQRTSSASSLSLPPAPAPVTELPPSRGSAPNLVRANAEIPGVASASAPSPRAPTVDGPALEVEPLTADLRRLHITVSKRLLDKIDAARDALSHSHPGASRDEVIEAALDLVLERAAKRRGIVKNPRKRTPEIATPPESATPVGRSRRARGDRSDRHVAAEVRRAIWERDGGRCQWKMEGGGVCGSTYQVELDHVVAYAKGGRIATAEDGELLCRPHNDRHAREVFGDAWMDRFTRRRARPPTCAPGRSEPSQR
jgi:hypothetical protein